MGEKGGEEVGGGEAEGRARCFLGVSPLKKKQNMWKGPGVDACVSTLIKA